jgi:hypothetical protein
MKKASFIFLIISLAALVSVSVINMLAIANQDRIRAMAEISGNAATLYVVAFGVAMPLSRFLEEVAPLLLFPMWPLLLMSSVVQVVALRRVDALRSNNALGAWVAVILAAPMALVVRVLYYISGFPDSAPFAGFVANSPYRSAVSLSSLVAIGISYLLLSLALLPKRNASSNRNQRTGG